MRSYFIGTSGYNYNNWNNFFYPSSSNKLIYYSKIFNSVEINSTYYYLYSNKVYNNWYRETPKKFKFSIKVHRTIINTNDSIKLKKHWNKFWKNAQILKDKISCLLFQFSSRFKYNEKSLEKLKLLHDILPKNDINYIFEFRDITWFNEDTKIISLFKKYNWTFCFIHVNNNNNWINSFPETSAIYPPLNKWNKYITNDITYFRFHGNDGQYVGRYNNSFLNNVFKNLNAKNNYIYFNNTDSTSGNTIDAIDNAKYLSNIKFGKYFTIDNAKYLSNIKFGGNKYSYKTFNGIYYVKSFETYEPSSLEEMKQLIKNTNISEIRVSGSEHTFNTISLSKYCIIRTTKLNKVININIDKKQITVEAGIKLYELNKILKEYELALPILPATGRASIVGCVSLGVHGSRYDNGSMSNMIVNMNMIDAFGNEHYYDSSHKYFKAIKCNLGCLGAIYTVTIQCEDLYSLENETKIINWFNFKKDMKSIMSQYPFTSGRLDPNTMKFEVTYQKKIPYIKNKPGYEDISSNKKSDYYIESEAGIDINKIDIIDDFCKYYNNYYTKNNIKSDSELLIRFCDKDDTLISMASERKTIFVSIFFGKSIDPNLAINTLKNLSDYLVEREGRPHYGKIHNLNKDKMKFLFGNNYYDFLKIKNILDPLGKFSNSYIKKLF